MAGLIFSLSVPLFRFRSKQWGESWIQIYIQYGLLKQITYHLCPFLFFVVGWWYVLFSYTYMWQLHDYSLCCIYKRLAPIFISFCTTGVAAQRYTYLTTEAAIKCIQILRGRCEDDSVILGKVLHNTTNIHHFFCYVCFFISLFSFLPYGQSSLCTSALSKGNHILWR